MHTYKDLIVWQKSIVLVTEVYKLTQLFPREEMYALTTQIRRACVSIPSNIAEGRKRGTDPQFIHFLEIAMGSAAELETQLYIAKKLKFTEEKHFFISEQLLLEVMKMLSKFVSNLTKGTTSLHA